MNIIYIIAVHLNTERNLDGFRFFAYNTPNQIQNTDFNGLVKWLNDNFNNKAYTAILNPDGRTYRQGTEVKVRLSSVPNGNAFDNLENLPKY